ncbi:type 1 glutamine amidotransferase [Aestuariivirga sp.]|uniref:type 1 glutamine amidotransferase n=1 Tax=Aestuariivirga sp. TaxID=2650926 RepID=UPI0039E45290
MKRALVLQHMDHDFPGRFLDFFAEDSIIPEFVRIWEGAEIPALKDYDFMFVLGGKQDTWEEAEYPWLVGEKQAIREWVSDRAKPYFGVCLGHQLLCSALGGEVAPAEAGEVGVHDVTLTEEGKRHRLFKGLPESSKVMQWHFAEVKRPPDGSAVLASSGRAAVQAVAIGDHAVGTQFHCEFTPQSMAAWSSLPDYISVLEKSKGEGAYPRLLAEAYPLMPDMHAQTRIIYENLARANGLRR